MDPAALDYHLDPAQIAQRPRATRDGGRLLVVARARGVVAHAGVADLPRLLVAGDMLVVNDAAVLSARLHGRRASGAAIEVLLTERTGVDGEWRCLARGAGRVREGERLRFACDLEGIWQGGTDGPLRTIRLEADGPVDEAVRRRGVLPLPPYIRRPNGPLAEDHERYQTVFARVPGAVAAPTAGLHFTPGLLAALAAAGIEVATLTLLVGPATFLPLRSTADGRHRVPAERYDIPATTAARVNDARAAGRRIVAVGTTTVRALESASTPSGTIGAGPGSTDLVIGPGHRFRAIDALLTNLHLPRSSLLGLVAAFAGVEPTLAAYRAASAGGYRFYSYGDAMLVQ